MKTKFIFAAIFTFLCILPPAMAQLLPLGSYQKIAKAQL